MVTGDRIQKCNSQFPAYSHTQKDHANKLLYLSLCCAFLYWRGRGANAAKRHNHFYVHRADAECGEFTADCFFKNASCGSLLTDPNAGINGQIFVFFIMVVAAAEVSVGLAIIAMMYRNTHSVDINFLNRLKH